MSRTLWVPVVYDLGLLNLHFHTPGRTPLAHNWIFDKKESEYFIFSRAIVEEKAETSEHLP